MHTYAENEAQHARNDSHNYQPRPGPRTGPSTSVMTKVQGDGQTLDAGRTTERKRGDYLLSFFCWKAESPWEISRLQRILAFFKFQIEISFGLLKILDDVEGKRAQEETNTTVTYSRY